MKTLVSALILSASFIGAAQADHTGVLDRRDQLLARESLPLRDDPGTKRLGRVALDRDAHGGVAAPVRVRPGPDRRHGARRRSVDRHRDVTVGQGHGIAKPSYQVDRFQRYIAWYDKYLKPAQEEKAR